MVKVSNPILSLLAATLFLFGINLSLQSARAIETDSANCIVAYSGPPPGQHWDLRGKCRYLHAGAPLMHRAAARRRAKATIGSGSTETSTATPFAAGTAGAGAGSGKNRVKFT